LKYAPKLTAFIGLAGSSDVIDNIKFCADQGFRAVSNNGVGKRPVAEQEAIAREPARLGMDLGPSWLPACRISTARIRRFGMPSKKAWKIQLR
jgi:hydroxypyruvate isomerase